MNNFSQQAGIDIGPGEHTNHMLALKRAPFSQERGNSNGPGGFNHHLFLIDEGKDGLAQFSLAKEQNLVNEGAGDIEGLGAKTAGQAIGDGWFVIVRI